MIVDCFQKTNYIKNGHKFIKKYTWVDFELKNILHRIATLKTCVHDGCRAAERMQLV